MNSRFLRDMDPRHSLVAGLTWLVIAMAAGFAIAASLWVGRVARQIVVQQHVRRLALESDQLGSDMSQAVNIRLQAIRVAGSMLPKSDDVLAQLAALYPSLDWAAWIDPSGMVLSGSTGVPRHSDVSGSPWFSAALRRPWVGVIDESAPSPRPPLLGDLAAPLLDPSGKLTGVIVAHLSWRWATLDVQRLSTLLSPRGSAQTLVLDSQGKIVVGPRPLLHQTWRGSVLEDSPAIDGSGMDESATPHFERLPEGETVLVARTRVSIGEPQTVWWYVQLSEPKREVFLRADALADRILWISICLGAAAAFVGALGARHLTNRLRRLTSSAAAVGRNEAAQIEVPRGRDEVAQLASAFAKILDDLRLERGELLQLSGELERRVAVRTREVERLAEESRYAAVVRERLKIARDLHDTLAHSMMAMLSEVRLLRKLQAHDPDSMAQELARAEEVAHAGLNEARTAIAQMRVNAVRDTGLGAALSQAIERFTDRTGVAVEFEADSEAGRFGDERAEVIFRMTEEALRNIERHAQASRVRITLRSDGTALDMRIADDGVGFDPSASRPGHFGLIGLHEQAQLIGAKFEIASTLDQGTVLTLSLRIAPEAL
jgi:signal transduction histidine kinase